MRKEWRMVIRGKHYPRPILTWSQCGLTEKMMRVIEKLNYEKPFPIQCQVRIGIEYIITLIIILIILIIMSDEEKKNIA